ncbi:COX15/CtaA family protein [Flavobacterium columnare]|nr:COX15/CtaA family protein [Flavobacterium columnare]APT22869.1 heme A synthase [Flavobacterium columnare]MEB3800218.1 COX15/CtaA family protein [Flavobacterium columnare]OOB84152.1 heme A synthase [Flavobacterium columnare]QOG91187.1 COX15/CtaA family protein [Flavobacterium columnare]QOG93845.1 COX15/CtaA family protein [Flavobacterium columnare]
MKMKFIKIAKTALILVYLVVIAGALVRMTGSGMGCPDWPKCFGYYIPPTNIQELTWTENRLFKKGQVIIKNEQLLVAKEDCITGKQFDTTQWNKYTKHDYAEFNPTHTWVEYINRLFGALSGFACLAMSFYSFSFWKKNKLIPILSWLVVFMMGFQAWLGATVVYSVLNPVKITLHMIMALVIIAFIIYIIFLADLKSSSKIPDNTFRNLLWVTITMTLIQVVLGTQVRQFIDEQVKSGIENPTLWLSKPQITFYIHRSFSILVLATNLFLYFRNKKLNLGFKEMNWVLLLLVLEILSGIFIYYLNFPFGSQTVHLVLASILFGIQFYMLLQFKQKNNISF